MRFRCWMRRLGTMAALVVVALTGSGVTGAAAQTPPPSGGQCNPFAYVSASSTTVTAVGNASDSCMIGIIDVYFYFQVTRDTVPIYESKKDCGTLAKNDWDKHHVQQCAERGYTKRFSNPRGTQTWKATLYTAWYNSLGYPYQRLSTTYWISA